MPVAGDRGYVRNDKDKDKDKDNNDDDDADDAANAPPHSELVSGRPLV